MYIPSTSNPMTDARVRSGLSANKLAKQLHLSRQYLSRVDQGTYTSINPTLLGFTMDALELDVNRIMDKYKEFQKDRRLETFTRVNPTQLAVEDDPNEKPRFYYEYFRDWREKHWATVNQFSSQMCVHPGAVTNYESGSQLCMPYMVRDTLNQLNLIHDSFSTADR